MKAPRISLICLAAVWLAGPARAQENGGEAAVVYNSNSAASKNVAEHYAERRAVPASQVIGLPLPEAETISRADFENRLQQPLWNELKRRKLFSYTDPAAGGAAKGGITGSAIRYAVLCYGVPLKIAPESGRDEAAAAKLPLELRRNEAAVDSELALLPVLDLKLPITGMTGNPFFLATNRSALHPTNGVLMFARVDGPTPAIAMGLVDKAMHAEKEGLWGRAYFDLRGLTNTSYKVGDDWLRSAAEASKSFGFETIVDSANRTFPPSAPLSDIALYFGWYDQSVSGPFTNGMAQFRPGAIAYHLHSFSSRVLRVTDTWWTGPLLGAGATATMGCTEEPYLQGTPQIHIFLSRLLFLGFSFGEAAYAAQSALSWQVTVVGDPLYRPFAKSQKERYMELEAGRSRDLEWSMQMWLNVLLGQGAPFEQVLQFYRENPETQNSAVLREKLADLHRSRGQFIEAIEHYLAALKLEARPVPRLRISLAAAALLSSQDRSQEAYALYQQVLREHPAYADKRDLYQKLARIAQGLGKPEEAAQYDRLAKDPA